MGIKDLRREFIWEALDGLVVQLEGAQRFLCRGEDEAAAAAMRRAHKFFKDAATEMGELVVKPAPVLKDGSEVAA